MISRFFTSFRQQAHFHSQTIIDKNITKRHFESNFAFLVIFYQKKKRFCQASLTTNKTYEREMYFCVYRKYLWGKQKQYKIVKQSHSYISRFISFFTTWSLWFNKIIKYLYSSKKPPCKNKRRWISNHHEKARKENRVEDDKFFIDIYAL